MRTSGAVRARQNYNVMHTETTLGPEASTPVTHREATNYKIYHKNMTSFGRVSSSDEEVQLTRFLPSCGYLVTYSHNFSSINGSSTVYRYQY